MEETVVVEFHLAQLQKVFASCNAKKINLDDEQKFEITDNLAETG